MGAQAIRRLVASVSSVLMVGLLVALGTQPGDRVAVPMAPVTEHRAPYSVSTAQPDLPITSRDSLARSLVGGVSALPVAAIAPTAAEEAPGEDTTVLTRATSVPTAVIPSVKPGTGTLLSMPVEGRRTSRFGMRFHPIRHIWKLHSGLDLAAPCGTPVGAAAPGMVVRTGWAGGNGIQVKIEHGMIGGHRVTTTYNHLSAIGVTVGQSVKAHQGVGRVGTTGFSTGCHLHFEVIADGNFTNPEPWLSGSIVLVDTAGMGSKQPAPPAPATSHNPVVPTSPSPSATPSLRPMGSLTPAPSSTPSPSVTPTASPSLSASPKPSHSPSASPKPSPSPSASPKPSPSASPSPSPCPSGSPAAQPPQPPCASVTPSGSLTPTVSPSPSPSPSPSAEPDNSPSPTPPTPSAESTATATSTRSVTQPSTPEATSPAPAVGGEESTPEA